MYQKFLLEIFYPSNLLEIFLGCISSWVSGVIGSSQVAPLCARIVRAESRAYDLFTTDQKICTWAPLLEIRNQLYRHRNDPHHGNDLRHRNDPQSPPK